MSDDTDAVLEMLEEEAMLCPGCGLPRDQTMDKEAQDAYESHALRCHSCAARERKAATFTKGTEGLMFTVERIEPQTP